MDYPPSDADLERLASRFVASDSDSPPRRLLVPVIFSRFFVVVGFAL
jgi:hypothetical protein